MQSSSHPLFGIGRVRYLLDNSDAVCLEEQQNNKPSEVRQLVQILPNIWPSIPSEDMSNRLAAVSPGYCSQCAPGTSTYAFNGDSYEGHCKRLRVNAETTVSGDGLLCIGESGRSKFCQAGEFMAVSHVRNHGWQGCREEGLCSRVLDILLTVARKFNLDWIWLDVALNSRNPLLRVPSEQFTWLFTNAKCTLVCDKFLFSLKGANALDKALALTTSEWNKRLWPMQEALLSKELWVLQKDDLWSVNHILNSLLAESRFEFNPGGYYKPIRDMSALAAKNSPILERVVYAGRGRRARKPLHLFKAVFPLFNLKWQPHTDYEVAHKLLMERIGPESVRVISLFAPFGIAPYTWAPLSLIGTNGMLVNDISKWLVIKTVISNVISPEPLHMRDQLPLVESEDGTKSVIFDLGDKKFHGKGYFSPTESFPSGDTWLLRPYDSWDEVSGVRYFIVGRRISTSNFGELWKFRKIGAVECNITECATREFEIAARWEYL